ncbi:centrosome-associated protein 350 [Rhinophrynus dorsalis]
MVEKSTRRGHRSSHSPAPSRGQEINQAVRRAWETIANTKAALRHTENKLDVAPTVTAVFDPVMDTKKSSSSSTRKISRKDGRYLEDSKPSYPSKSGREKSSRSPLRVTTLESNVKSAGHVAFREPLASYREPVNGPSTSRESVIMRPASGLNVDGKEERDFESTRSSAVDETSVRYLNDRPAIDALALRSQSEIEGSLQQTHYRGLRPPDTSQQSTSFSPSSRRLETLKRRQPDAKLEKLKERIRRQWELSGERDAQDGIPSAAQYIETVTSAKTRKVTSAPPPPVYRGFNPPETKIRTTDGKLWQEDEFHNFTAQLFSALQPTQEGTSTNEKSRIKRVSRPVRKVQRVGAGSSASPDSKAVKGHIISASSWRDGQKLVKQILGPAPKVERESKALSVDGCVDKVTSSQEGQMDKRPMSSEHSANKRSVSTDRLRERRVKSTERQIVKRASSQEKPTENSDVSNKSDEKKHQNECAEVKKDFLPLEIRGILDDLQLDSGIDVQKQSRGRSHSPTKRKPSKGHAPEEPHISSKRRHYDAEQVRLYILRQQEERKRRQQEEKEAQRQAEEQKNKRLQELYQKQKEAFSKAKSGPAGQRLREREAHESVSNQSSEPKTQQLQETNPRLVVRHAWSDPSAKEKQSIPLYQPSGESDKENKGQERPPSASSSSDLSLSEPLIRRDIVDTHQSKLDRLTSKGPLNPTPGGAEILSSFFTLPKELESLLNTRKYAMNAVPETHKTGLQAKPSTDFRSNLDRIETLKATAVSLSSRIESEAKKLAGGPLTFQSSWGTDPDALHRVTTTWKKPDSPPEREGDVDVFSVRIQKMLGTSTSQFSQKDLPGANSLYKKCSDDFHTQIAASVGRVQLREEERSSLRRNGESVKPANLPNKTSPSQNSSTSSISEGPLLSEGSLSEGEGVPSRGSPLHSADALKSKGFCIRDTKSLGPLAEFQKEAEKYPPVLTSSIASQVKGPWEELTKGSPHSVINIFTKSYQMYGKGLDGQRDEGSTELKPLYTAASPQDNLSYADDFVSSHISESSSDAQKTLQPSIDTSASSVKEELPLVKSRNEESSSHSSGSRSAVSSPGSSSSRRGGKQRKSWQNGGSQLSLEHDQSSSGSEHKGQGIKHSQSLSPGRERPVGSDTDSTIGDLSSRSLASSHLSDSGRAARSHHSNLMDTGGQVSTPPESATAAGLGSQAPGLVPGSVHGSMRFSPAVLQQRMSAELNYLTAMEESVRQLCDVERVRGISLAQQETVSLAQILKAQQQLHEQNMVALRQQAEQEAHASLRQLEESRQRAAQTQAEILQQFQKTLETSASQNPHRMQEELDRGYLSPTSSDPTVTSLDDQQNRSHSLEIRKKGSHSMSPSSQPTSTASSIKEHLQSSSDQGSPPPASILEAARSHSELEESIIEDVVLPGSEALEENSSQQLQEKDSSSAGLINEEGNEELSFRSLLPSEAHRRGSLERQRSQRHESDEESTPDKELSGPFSSGQDSFWRFTMEMVRQYMQEGEMRSAHQAALLRLRQKALKDKTKAELAWLEHQKRRLRDKGEDDKMPPLRKRQRGLLLRLQQEQAEIKRLQEANKAARRERKLILKQQEEIQRIQNSTLRLQEKLKSAESGQLEPASEVDIQPSPTSSHVPSEAESRSPSPVSVSGSETSSIMQKLRKMHSHMDAKDICPVHCFFSVFTPQHWASLSVCFPKLHPKFQLYICRQLLRFLTKREQQLVQRRLHAQELLEWKRRLDAEELEIRRIEKQALAVWDNQRGKTKNHSTDDRERVGGEKESRGGSSVPLSPTILTKTSSPLPEYMPSESFEPTTISEQIHVQSEEHSSISEELGTSSLSKVSPPRSSKSPRDGESSKESPKTSGHKVHITLRPHQLSHTCSEESLSMTHSETTSDQSDIEGRVRALKEELRKRKSVVDNLKREQKRRQKERLRAQEAILLQQLKSYDEYILKTQAELSGEQGTTTSAKPVPKTTVPSREAHLTKPDSVHRFDGTATCKSVCENEHHVEFSTKSDESFSQERSQSISKGVAVESVSEQSRATYVPFSIKEDIPAALQSSPQSPVFRDHLSSSPHGSPVSSIHSEIPEEMLESHLYNSPPPSLSLNLRSPTPEESLSPHRDHSYSDDFEASAPMKQSVTETPREELEVSYTTTPGRDIPSEGLQEDEHSECRLASPHSLEILELNPPSQDLLLSRDVTDSLADFFLGDRVLVSGVQPGTLRYKGETFFAEGVWAGVELDTPEGNNDGSHGGKRYFTCSHQHGIFAPPHKITHLSMEKQTPFHTFPHREGLLFGEERSSEHKDEPDGHLSPPSVYLHEREAPELINLELVETGSSGSHSTAVKEQFPKCDLHIDLITETTTTVEENKEQNTPLLDILVEEKPHQDALSVQGPKVSTLSESVLQICLKDTVTYLQNIRKGRAERIQKSNQELLSTSSTDELPRENEEAASEATHPRLDLMELKPSHILLSALSDEPDWFDEDFGLSSRRTQQQDLEHVQHIEPTPEPCLLVPHPEPAPKPMLPLLPPESFIAVPHSVLEVEQLVCAAADELWRSKQLHGDLLAIRTSFTQTGEDEQSPAICAYKEVVFDLTLHIFDEMCFPEPRGSQPLWKKPSRVSPSYARRVRDPRNLEEVKAVLTDEVLTLMNLKKEQNHKTDWQRMMKFGRKKRDRVDHILVQELHEEEAQWVNYDEDELFVKMQLADGIFEALIRDTVHVLQRIQEKKNQPLLV